MDKDTIIVGYGPSLAAEDMGHLIDEHKRVVRIYKPTLKEMMERNGKTLGKKIDVLCGSYVRGVQLLEVESPEYWLFFDSRTMNTPRKEIEFISDKFPKNKQPKVDQALCNFWDERYREVRDTMGPCKDWDPRQKVNHPLGHNHLSAGLHALIYALDTGAKSICLVGFDNVGTGAFNFSLTRGPGWNAYPDHRWDVEHEMVDMLSEYYKIPIGYMWPDCVMAENES